MSDAMTRDFDRRRIELRHAAQRFGAIANQRGPRTAAYDKLAAELEDAAEAYMLAKVLLERALRAEGT